MKKVDMIVKAPHFYTMEGEGVGYKTGVAMIVNAGKIEDFVDAATVDSEFKADEVLDLKEHVIFPGLIDAHMHTLDNVMRGLAQDSNNWMMQALQPFANAANAEDTQIGSRVAIIEAVKAGTTCLGDYNTQIDTSAEFINKIGARGNLAVMFRAALRKVYMPGELYEFDDDMGEREMQGNIDAYNKWHGNGNIRVLFGPQGADFLSPEMLLKAQKAAKERHTKLHVHVQQGDRETYQIVKRYGKRPTQFLSELGILDKDLIAVHLTDCNEEETRVIARSGAGMVVNPASIGIIDGIVCPSLIFQEEGGMCGLGSDQAPGNNCHNIIHEMKNVCLFNKIKYGNPEIMPAWKALRMATIEGAKAIGVDDVCGSLEIGKSADFIAVSLNFPSMLPVYTYPMRNMVPNFVYSARGEEVTHSVVAGKVIMRDRKLTAIDEQEYLDAIKTRPQALGERAAKEWFGLDGINNKYMQEDKL